MWSKVTTTAIAVLLLTGFALGAQAQLGSTTGPYGTTTGGSSSKKKPAQSDSTAGKPGVDAFGAGDASRGSWTGTNPGVTRRPSGGLPGYGPGYTGAPVVPGGNGALGAGDAAIGSWTGTNPGIDRRAAPGGSYSRGSYYGMGGR
jgi:hypothetical protein